MRYNTFLNERKNKYRVLIESRSRPSDRPHRLHPETTTSASATLHLFAQRRAPFSLPDGAVFDVCSKLSDRMPEWLNETAVSLEIDCLRERKELSERRETDTDAERVVSSRADSCVAPSSPRNTSNEWSEPAKLLYRFNGTTSLLYILFAPLTNFAVTELRRVFPYVSEMENELPHNTYRQIYTLLFRYAGPARDNAEVRFVRDNFRASHPSRYRAY